MRFAELTFSTVDLASGVTNQLVFVTLDLTSGVDDLTSNVADLASSIAVMGFADLTFCVVHLTSRCLSGD